MPRPMSRSADHPLLVLDACAVLNLAAAFTLPRAGVELGCDLVVVRQAADEALFIDDLVDGTPTTVPVDVSPLRVVNLAAEELGRYVTLTADLDDGEAATLAAAQQRGWPVMTDDRKALRVATEMSPAVVTVTTPSVLRRWSASQPRGDEDVAAVLRRVERMATYTPRRTGDDGAWWHSTLGR